MEEPSVLDYIKSKIAPWKYPPLEIPAGESYESTPVLVSQAAAERSINTLARPQAGAQISLWPWRLLAALFFALLAQSTLEPGPERTWTAAVFLYLLSFGALAWSIQTGELKIPAIANDESSFERVRVRTRYILASLFFALVAFLFLGGNEFNLVNLGLLLLSVGFLVAAFWQAGPGIVQGIKNRLSFFSRPSWPFTITRWSLAVAAAVVLVLFFRLYALDQVPPEMNSDHAEKILDILGVLNGQTHIFFPNNGGREALQMYLVAGLHRFFNIELNYLALKLVTVSTGLLSLPFIYLIGKEIANRRVGLLAFVFAGVAYWPNVVSRVGLRLPFYILFTASTLYFLIRGLRRSRNNDFLLAGLSLGLSFYGYSADRILPLVVVAAVGIYLLHNQAVLQRKTAIILTIVLLAIAAIMFLPMLRFMLEDPESFLYRTLSRMSGVERPLPAPAWQVFLVNMVRALVMPFWSDGEVWTISVPFRPALDVVAGALFWLGFLLVFIRYLRQRYWLDLFLLVSFPLLLLPSVLALAFPAENPNLYRTGGALVPVFLLVAIALDRLMASLQTRLASPLGSRAAWGFAAVLLLLSGLLSWELVFNQYYREYQLSSWNSSEMGRVMRVFSETVGSADSAWVVGFPHWVDTRLVGMRSGDPLKDFQLLPDQIESTQEFPSPKLFLLKPEDQDSLAKLRQLYPAGSVKRYASSVESKDFLMFFVPPQ